MVTKKASIVFDNSSYGLSPEDIQLEVEETSFNKLKTYMSNSPLFKRINDTNKYALYLDDSNEALAYYELIQGFSTEWSKTGYFINATVTPARLISGDNILPVVINTGKRPWRETMLYTLRILNRLAYTLLERLPEIRINGRKIKFSFSKEDKRKIENGDITISRLQVAWYSGDLLKDRNTVLSYLRILYSGLSTSVKVNKDGDIVKMSSVNLGDLLGINATAWPNNFNLTLMKYHDKTPQIKLVCYAKDEEIEHKASDNCIEYNKSKQDRVSGLIRFDCTIMNATLHRLFGLKDEPVTVRSLETKYACDISDDGFDTPFTRSIADFVYSTFKLNYLLNMTIEDFKERYDRVEKLTKTNNTLGKLAVLWIKNKTTNRTQRSLAEELNVSVGTINSTINKFEEATDIDFDVSCLYHVHMFSNALHSMMTNRERKDELNNDNFFVSKKQRESRLIEIQKIVRSRILKASRLRVFSIKPITEDEIFVYSSLKQ